LLESTALSYLAGGCLGSCTVDSEESEACSEEEDSKRSGDEEFEWTWSAMPKWGALARNRVVWRRLCKQLGLEQRAQGGPSGGASR
jgi:hypothetical protein